MPLDDANVVPDEPQDEPQPAPPPEPEPQEQEIDVDTAYEVIARREGWDPRLTRYQIDEHKRRVQDFEREKKEFDRQRASYQPEETSDPYLRRMANIERMFQEDRQERQKERESERLVNRVSQELGSAYSGMGRQSGWTKQQLEERAGEFYETLNDLYPDPTIVREIGPERAARNAFRLLNSNGSRPRPQQPNVNGRGPTAIRTIPGSPQPYLPSGSPQPQEESNSADQLPEETDDQYRDRLQRIYERGGRPKIPDKTSVQSR